jgi:solute carrier family 8 (sodium/calcium exchanger)
MALAALPVLVVMTFADLFEFAEAADLNDTVVENKTCNRFSSPCKEGLFLPMWKPQGSLSNGDKAARATVYMVALVYMFLGVSIIADRFMASIEVITSKEKEVVVKRPDGQTQVVNVRIWNETVSNLTLMALGSSAPEILLSVIEICGNNFEAGDLGPSTIVGSAAFNLFIIIAICVYCIPDDEVRRIKHLGVFFVTATWSVFAYLWLYFIIAVSSNGVVDVWEAVLTLFFFPLTVGTAYIADQKILVYKFLPKKYSASDRGTVLAGEGLHETEMADGSAKQITEEGVIFKGTDSKDVEVREFEQHRRDFIEIMRELRQKNPNIDMKTLEEMAEYEAVNRGPKSRAFYRIQATRKLTGGGKVIKKAKIEEKSSLHDVKEEVVDSVVTQVFFDPGHYTVMENVGSFNVTVTREGGDMSKTCHVDYGTEDGTATSGTDYIGVSGTLVFQPHERHQQFEVTILDDDVFEEDEHFYVTLANARLSVGGGKFDSSPEKIEIRLPFMATVMILDDDHPGIFHFSEKDMTITENIGELLVKINRASGARGCVKVPFHAVDGSAKAGKDYEMVSGEVFFENDETEQFVKIRIVDDEEYEKSENFSLVLDEPVLVKKGSGKKGSDSAVVVDEDLGDMGKPRLGETTECTVAIKESQEFKSTVDKLLKKANVSLVVGTSSWREQFVEAISVSAGDDDEDENDEDAEEKLPSCGDYVMHFLTLIWKILFAFVPPTDYFGGWACFVVSIALIGLLTGVIGDLASSFGCTVGLKDSVTAISFVALGTSVPDTFASKVSAANDRYADASVGNVTGSNAVNVFLGIGIAWTIAAVYHAVQGRPFLVDPGELAMSVTIFCIMALITIVVLVLRRKPTIGGELGGPPKFKTPTSILLCAFWMIYVLISAFVSYCYIPSF